MWVFPPQGPEHPKRPCHHPKSPIPPPGTPPTAPFLSSNESSRPNSIHCHHKNPHLPYKLPTLTPQPDTTPPYFPPSTPPIHQLLPVVFETTLQTTPTHTLTPPGCHTKSFPKVFLKLFCRSSFLTPPVTAPGPSPLTSSVCDRSRALSLATPLPTAPTYPGLVLHTLFFFTIFRLRPYPQESTVSRPINCS